MNNQTSIMDDLRAGYTALRRDSDKTIQEIRGAIDKRLSDSNYQTKYSDAVRSETD